MSVFGREGRTDVHADKPTRDFFFSFGFAVALVAVTISFPAFFIWALIR